jgi:hypothetical protein
MKVNKKLAAKMVGIGRTTFYRHIEEKPISVDSDGQIDVSELIRVYGNENVKTPEQLKASSKTPDVHDGTQQNTQLLEEIKRLKGEIDTISMERRRERDQFSNEIEHLRNSLKQSMDQNNSLTRLLTDERTKEEKLVDQKKVEQEDKLETVLKTLQSLEAAQKKSWWPFSRKIA